MGNWRTWGWLTVAGFVVAACAGDSDTADPSLASAPPAETDPSATTGTTASTSTTTTPTTTLAPTTAVTEPEQPDCDRTQILALADEVLERARLVPGEEWIEADESHAFVARTNTAAEFAHRVGSFDCSARLAQGTDTGAARLLLAAWVGDRAMYVLQATDPPGRPYDTAINFQLMVETAYGEMLREGFEWAGTLEGGESIVVGAVDGPVALAAKSWPAAVPRFEDLPVTLPTEQYAIDTLEAAGARNVSVAEPAGQNWEIAAIQFVTPAGLHLIATVATPDWFAADAELFPGETSIEDVDGVEVHVRRGAPDAYAVASTGWTCGEHVWFIDSVWGAVDELLEWTGELIAAGDCAA